MTIFDDYKDNKGRNTVSPTLLWEYDLTHFDWQRSRKIVVQRIIERGWLKDYFAAFDLYGGRRIPRDHQGGPFALGTGHEFCLYGV